MKQYIFYGIAWLVVLSLLVYPSLGREAKQYDQCASGPRPGMHFVGILVLHGSCYSAQRNPTNITFQGKNMVVVGFAHILEDNVTAILSRATGALNATIATTQFHGICRPTCIYGIIIGSWEEWDIYG